MRLRVSGLQTGCRLDKWLDGQLPDVSRARIQSFIKTGNITVNGARVAPHKKIVNGFIVDVVMPPVAEARLSAEDIRLDVIYEDSDIVVVNKPPGLVVHPGAGHASGTLANAILYRCSDIAGVGGEMRPGIVHRLDKDTSGLLVVAKNDMAHRSLTSQFKEGIVKKKYVALVSGVPCPESGRIETFIGRSRGDRKKMVVRMISRDEQLTKGAARRAVTNYAVLEKLGKVCLLNVEIETGRTHQIRVHMAHIGHPVVGDKQYGGRRWRDVAECVGVGRQLLHARQLSFLHPRDGKRVVYTAQLPFDFMEVLKRLRC
ncbi:MAG: RluA family pseudouridine synthase [Lentisphaerae bacterium]|nr:RluA family pseudouridine synthase [Lentisphaerota bacterium]